jgi:hypothetical protein
MNHDAPQAGRGKGGADLPSNPYQRAAWDVALVCLGGHLLNDRVRGDPSRNLDECPTCGSEAISACPGCREPVPGFHYEQGDDQASLNPRGRALATPPRYCPACGRPFPWTERVMSAVRMVIREMAALDLHERDQLRRSIDHIIRQTPQTPQAVRRINDALSRLGGESAHALRDLFLSIASAEVKAQLGDQE